MQRSKILLALVVINSMLVAAVASRLVPDNWAFGQAKRAPDYLQIPARVPGNANTVIYVIDTANGQLGAAVYDDAQKRIDHMPVIDITRVFETGGGAVPGTGRKNR